MAKTIQELAQLLNAQVVGDGTLEIHQVVHPLQAREARDLALILDPKILEALSQLNVQCALVPMGLDIPSIPNQLKVTRPKVALATLLTIFEKPVHIPEGIHISAIIDPSAEIAPDVTIGPLCSVGPGAKLGAGSRLVSRVHVGAQAVIGENCTFYPGVCIGDRVQIGNRVIVQANATVGNDGYSYVTPEAGSVESARATGEIKSQNTGILRINSVGTVVLEDEVEIGANTCIDRATLGETRIGRGTKIDNLVQIAHNVTIGQNCLIVSQVGIAGSSTIGDRTVLAGQVGIPDHIHIGEDCIVMPQAGVKSDIPAKSIYVGSPAIPRREFLSKEMNIKRIKGLSQSIKSLTARLDAIAPETSPSKDGQEVSV